MTDPTGDDRRNAEAGTRMFEDDDDEAAAELCRADLRIAHRLEQLGGRLADLCARAESGEETPALLADLAETGRRMDAIEAEQQMLNRMIKKFGRSIKEDI